MAKKHRWDKSEPSPRSEEVSLESATHTETPLAIQPVGRKQTWKVLVDSWVIVSGQMHHVSPGKLLTDPGIIQRYKD